MQEHRSIDSSFFFVWFLSREYPILLEKKKTLALPQSRAMENPFPISVSSRRCWGRTVFDPVAVCKPIYAV